MQDLTSFWLRLQSSIEVAVATDQADKLLGVRDGFGRCFREGLERSVLVEVISKPRSEEGAQLPLTDEGILKLARRQALELERVHKDAFPFYVGTEAGLLMFETEGESRHFVRSWTVVIGLGTETWGSSGSLQLPQHIIRRLEQDGIPSVFPGTRRRGGMVSCLTGSVETRRSSTALATFNALSSLMYGRLDNQP